MYGDAFVNEYLKAAEAGDEPTLRRILARHRIAWSIFPPHYPINRRLRSWGWRTVHADDRAVVLEAPGADGAAPR